MKYHGIDRLISFNKAYIACVKEWPGSQELSYSCLQIYNILEYFASVLLE